MKNNIALPIMLGMVVLIILFHLGVIFRILPFEFIWGGQISTTSEMYLLVTISILLNLFLGLVLVMKGGYVKHWFGKRVTDFFLWLFLILFTINTIGNLLAETIFEKSLAVVTLIFAILIGWILKADNHSLQSRKKSQKDQAIS